MGNVLIFDKQTGSLRKSDDVDLVDMIMELKALKGPWAVIDKLMEVWYQNSPEDAQGVLINVGDLRETRKDKEFGKTEDKNMNRRILVIFPLALQHMIRKVYGAEE